MKRFRSLAMGVVTGVGGFVDMGGIIASTQAGAQFRFGLLWTLIPGILGLLVFTEMSGRVVIASGQTLFDAIRDRLGHRLALIPLASTLAVNVLTLVVEVAGMSLAFQLVSGINYLWWFPLVELLMVLVLWRASFSVLDTGSALLGLAILIAVAGALKLQPNWPEVAIELVHPRLAGSLAGAYAFTAISLLGSYLTPYQFAFYSSGAIEEEWKGEDLLTNRFTSVAGSLFGGIIVFALMLLGALVLYPKGTSVDSLAVATQPIEAVFGRLGLALFILGVVGATMGAGLETALSGTYALCQYCGWDWGKVVRPRKAPIFHIVYLLLFLVALGIGVTRVDPIQLTLATMALAAIGVPFTFIPLLIVANDRDYVGDQRNTISTNVIGGLILAVLIVSALIAIPLMLLRLGSS